MAHKQVGGESRDPVLAGSSSPPGGARCELGETLGISVYAHTLPNQPQSEWELLDRHLAAVAEGDESFCGAAGFAAVFGARELARVAGLWHDLGKYAPQFQKYLRDSVGRVDHSTAGALHAIRRFNTGIGRTLAFIIAGHHAGLADLGTDQSDDDSCLSQRLATPRVESIDAIAAAPDALKQQPIPPVPSWLAEGPRDAPLRVSMLIRMLFSCLIDADRLATEGFCAPERRSQRVVSSPSMSQLRAALDEHLLSFARDKDGGPSPVNRVRAQVLAACRADAESPQGLFSLTAPTGAGKTLSSMAFALRHAEIHGLRRVIYALPFTSVTEQNAAVFREAFRTLGEHSVLEHHSAYRATTEDEDDSKESWRRLAVENWDAPIIVTTNVQLLESLFASNPSECRKLHRIVRSVVVLDEAQSLPAQLLRPTLAALQELVSVYGVSVVLCSATMPAVGHRSDFPIGLRNVREIVPEPEAMARSMRRARVTPIGTMDDESLADRVAAEKQVLAIVNTRKHATRLFRLILGRTTDVLHLSALMCPEHRSRRVDEIKQRLKEGAPCRVVSTQVVEAGVDVDFQAVFRAYAGLDSIVQAAGRCNREGRREVGRVEVFDTDEPPPPGIRPAIDATRQVLEPGIDPLDLGTIEAFFRLHYWQRGDPAPKWDGPVGADGRRVGITEMLSPQRIMFRTAAQHYKLIDEWAVPIVVPFGDAGRKLCGRLLTTAAPDLQLLRQTQRYSVNVPRAMVNWLIDAGHAAISAAGPAVLERHSLYDDDQLGLRLDGTPNPTDLFA